MKRLTLSEAQARYDAQLPRDREAEAAEAEARELEEIRDLEAREQQEEFDYWDETH